MHGVCLEHFVTSRLQKFPHLRQVEPLLWCLSLATGAVSELPTELLSGTFPGLCMGCVWNILSPADSKSQRFPISAQKAGRTTFVVSFIWLPGQCQNYQQNSFLAPSPGELCMADSKSVPHLEHFVTSRLQKSAIPHLSTESQVEPLLWCLSSGYRGSVRTTNRTPFWHLPRGSCAWRVFGTFCHQPTPKVNDSPSQHRKQVEPLLWCLSFCHWLPGQCVFHLARTSNRTPFWHLPRGSCAWGVFGTFCHQPTPKVSDCPSLPRKQVDATSEGKQAADSV